MKSGGSTYVQPVFAAPFQRDKPKYEKILASTAFTMINIGPVLRIGTVQTYGPASLNRLRYVEYGLAGTEVYQFGTGGVRLV